MKTRREEDKFIKIMDLLGFEGSVFQDMGDGTKELHVTLGNSMRYYPITDQSFCDLLKYVLQNFSVRIDSKLKFHKDRK